MSDHLSGFSGASGISYGLNIRGGAAKKKAPAAAAKPQPALAAFAVDSDDELDGLDAKAGANVLLQRQQQALQAQMKTQQLHQRALAEDASVFDYDGVYEEMKGKTQGTAQEKKAARPQSKYIAQLKLKAEERNREQDVVFERRQIKEREKEDHLYGDKEKFVTSAYKKKLEEARAPQIRADAKA